MFSFHEKIIYLTFKNYVSQNEAKRQKVEIRVGTKPLVTPSDQLLLAHVMARKYRANSGMKPTEAYDMVQEIIPMISHTASIIHFNRTLVKKHTTVVKSKQVVSQNTTTRRSAITIIQKFLWHTIYEDDLNELRSLNTGVCSKLGKTFGELIHEFIIRGDETCFQACDNKSVVIGSAGRTKHEKKIRLSGINITLQDWQS